MPSAYLADDLLDAVRDEGFLPTADEASAARLFGIMNREQRTYLSHVLLSAREEFQTAETEIALDGSTRYPVPSRAIGAKLKQVLIRDAAGNETPLHPAPLGKKALASPAGTGQYALRGLYVELFDTTSIGTLVLRHYRRFNKLVPAAECAEITAIGATVTIDVVPTGWATTATPYDFIQASPHFDVLGTDISATRASLVLTPSSVPADLAVGDYVALAGESPICNAPLELHDLLVARAVYMYWLGQKDPAAAAAKERFVELERIILPLISPRVEDSDQVLVNYDAPGWNRWRGRRVR